VTVVFAAFLPLAGGLYLLTTTTWTLLERRLLARRVQQAPAAPGAGATGQDSSPSRIARCSAAQPGEVPGRAARP
jgi:hypothetical protein